MKALHFGAGNIGKGFIGYLLNKTGYEVCFVDVNEQMINNFNENHSYVFEVLDDCHTLKKVSPVSGINSITQEKKVLDAIVNADIITTSVGINNLSKIANTLSKGLLMRAKKNKKKIDVIANENAINASSTLKWEIGKYISTNEMKEISSFVGFPNSAIDRLALSRQNGAEEITLVEPFYEWIINKSEMVNKDLPTIKNAIYVDDLKPYIERKLYIVNMGHATIAYISFLAGKSTIQSALENSVIKDFVRKILQEASHYIIQSHDFSADDMSGFIDATLKRFQNEKVSDDILRVGRSPIRKLSYDERLIKPTKELFDLGFPIEYLSIAVASAFLFDNAEDEESVLLKNYIHENGIEQAILKFTQIDNEVIKEKIMQNYKRFKGIGKDDVIVQLKNYERGI